MTKTIFAENLQQKITIRKSKRAKYMQIKIEASGQVILVLPRGYSERDGIRFLKTKKDWVRRKSSSIDFYNEKFRYLGEEIILKQNIDCEGQKFVPFLVNQSSTISEKSYKVTSNIYDDWLFEKAENYLIPRVFELAAKHDYSFKKVSVKRMKSRWGSCSSKKRLSFNSKLMYFNTKVIDYILIHELCHLKEMNHSNRFWELVEAIVPDYKILRKQLTYN